MEAELSQKHNATEPPLGEFVESAPGSFHVTIYLQHGLSQEVGLLGRFEATDRCDGLALERMGDGGLRFGLRFEVPDPTTSVALEAWRKEWKFKSSLPYWRWPGDLKQGALFVSIPGEILQLQAAGTVIFAFDGLKLAVYLDGVLIDEEWSYGRPRIAPAEALTLHAEDGVPLQWEASPGIPTARWFDDNFPTRGATADRLLGYEEPFGAYWKPRGINTSAGDVMLAFGGARLHLIYLRDRRNHGSLWGRGAHEFCHWSTADLRNWTEHPDVLKLDSGAEASIGTGGMLFHEGLFHVWGNRLSNRNGPEAEQLTPSGIVRAISQDGERFERVHGDPIGVCEPGIWHDESTGVFHMLSPARRMESTDLHHWVTVDEGVLPPSAPIGNRDGAPTGECYCLFEWNGWFYVIGGRTGFWMGRDVRGPFHSVATGKVRPGAPRWSIYDGSMVPMAVVIQENRCLLAGWVVDHWWGGRLVFRELKQEGDGTLALGWVPEMVPETETSRILAGLGTEEGRADDAGCLDVSEGCSAFHEYVLPAGDCRVRMRLRPGRGCRAFGVNLRGDEDCQGGRELRFAPEKREARWGTPNGLLGSRGELSPRHNAGDFAIENVEGLNGEVELDIILKDWVVDAWINRQRTMLTRSHEAKGERLSIFAEGGPLEYDPIEYAPLKHQTRS